LAATPPTYWAFISYSHRDEKWASWLHRQIETYTGHKKLVGTTNRYGEPVPARPFPVFRDRDELESASDLPGRIQDALGRSRFLIVVCSPDAARSTWVNEEIKTFKALGREDRVLAVVVAGEPNAVEESRECFPPTLRFRVGADGQLTGERTEPLAADTRKQGDGERGALLKLLAAILGVRFDDLRQRDLERQRQFWRRVGIGGAAAVAVLAGLTIFAFMQRSEAIRQRDIAEQRARDAVSRQLAQAAEGVLATRPDRALLLAAHATMLSPTFETRRVLRLVLRKAPRLERFLSSSGETVTAIAVDPVGKHAAIGRTDGDVAVFDLESGALLPGVSRRLPAAIFLLSFTANGPDGLVAVTRGGALRRLGGGEPSEPVDLHTEGAKLVTAAFGGDGKILATLDEDRRLVLWDADKRPAARRQSFELPQGVRPPLRVTSAGRVAFFKGENRVVTVHPDTGRVTEDAVQGEEGELLQISPDGREVARWKTGEQGLFTVQNVATGQHHFTRSSDEIFALTFSPDGDRIAVSHANGAVAILARAGGAEWVRLPAAYVWVAAFDATARRLVTGGDSGAVAVWKVGPSARTFDAFDEEICGHQGRPHSLALSPPGDLLVAACEKGGVKVKDLARLGEAARSASLPQGREARALVFMANDRVLALLDDGQLVALDVRATALTESAMTPIAGVRTAVALGRNGPTVGALTREVEILTWGAGQRVQAPTRTTLPAGDWGAFAIGPDGGQVVVADSQGQVVRVDRRTKRTTTLVSGGAKIVSLGISPDGKFLALVDDRGRLTVRGLDGGGSAVRAIEGVRGPDVHDTGPLVSGEADLLARAVEYSPDGRYLAIATDEGTLLLDPSTLRRLGDPVSRDTGRAPFAFDGSGSRMARVFRVSITTSTIGIEVEDLTWSSWVRAACRMANRELAEIEIQTYLGGVPPGTTCASALRAGR
jgi:WD40 repeat protein